MKAFKLFSAASIVALFLFTPTVSAALPNAAEAITLRNAINNNTQAGRNLGNNNTIIATYLPRMGDCKPVYTIAKNAMEQEIAYIAGGGTNVTVRNAYISQVNSALSGGTACAQTPRTPPEIFNANGVKYINNGYPSNSFANAIVTTSNNMPPALRAKLVAAYKAGWTFYVFRTPDDFRATLGAGLTQAQYNDLKVVQAATFDPPAKVQIFFEYFYNPNGNKQLVKFTAYNPTATVAHEVEHINDIQLNMPSVNNAGFNTAYLQGVARYNAAGAGKNRNIGAEFITDPHGKSELFAELGAYWDTLHWSVSGVKPAMSSTFYTPAQVIQFFPEAWTYFQAKKTAKTW